MTTKPPTSGPVSLISIPILTSYIRFKPRICGQRRGIMVPWNAPRAKVSPPLPLSVPYTAAPTKLTSSQVQIRLSIQRLRNLQEKKLALAKKSRRDIADLLSKGRVETSRLRVEGLIQEDIYVELLELLEVSPAKSSIHR